MSIKRGGLATCVFVFLFGVIVYPVIAANKEFIFVHAPQGDWVKSHKDVIINYLTWDGTKWTAKLEKKPDGSIQFVHAPQGNWAKSHKDMIINYLTWDAGKWTAKVNIE
jgi:hypothetical protein